MTETAAPGKIPCSAVDPTASVWVAASAGTGKTTVLTNRLLSLMLAGTDPTRILCLTFTRAAAAEMANRVNARLAEWATMMPGRLAQELVAVTGEKPDAETAARARQLFARVLDAPGGIKIATIHAFCQSLLRRFPLEAGVSPEFTVIEERSAGEALAEASETVLAAARAGGDAGLAAALALVARHAPEERFAELMTAVAGDRGRFAAVQALAPDELRARLCAVLGIAVEATPDTLLAEFCAGGDLPALRAAAAVLDAGSPADRGRAGRVAAWCADAARRGERLADYVAAYLTDKGDIRQTLITRSAAGADIAAAAALAAEGARVKMFCEAQAAAALADATLALIRLGGALLDAYGQRKRRHAQLDYDDLVGHALALLRRPGVAPWVLFKLDGGLDHILIDEAQDTNPEQWAIVAALADEFFAGDDPRGRIRTVFAVGDAKQSIYSFQRADPQAFLAMRRHFRDRVDALNQRWVEVPLEVSYRATAPLLATIDAVFANPEAADGVALDDALIHHVAARADDGGIVELWPPVPAAPEMPDDPLDLPVTHRRVAAPEARLARAIAATIARWLADGEVLPAAGRALRPGDIMVLVRRRNAFVGELLRALKQRGIPVAGADRLRLMEQLAVKDLVALGRFLLLPDDDLTLATVLKGPLFAVSEAALFDLAHERGTQTLWRRLRDRAAAMPELAPIARRLGELLARADFAPPYELYAEILGADGGRRALLERLGPEAADPVEEFLALALAYEREHVPSLQGFLRWLAAGDTEIKRDLAEHQRDEIRILTVHGAKGLEAPVVFLPDTMQMPQPRAAVMWHADGLPLWCPRQALAAPAYATVRDAFRRAQMQEYRRLLYVALTRARDRLYICGWETRNPATGVNWHTLCAAGLRRVGAPFAFDAAALLGGDGWAGEGWRLASPALRVAAPAAVAPALCALALTPAWVAAPPPPEPDPPRPLVPSRPEGSEPPALSPLAGRGRDRFKRGLLVHRLLQSLPELPDAAREAAARRFLALPTHALAPAEQDEICGETLAVLRHPDLAALFGPQSRAEVPIVGLIGGQALSGQIDRLVVLPERVLVVDYKTLRPPPQSVDSVPAVYLQQLAVYRAALARIYPDRVVDCALLWTEAPRLMAIPAALLDRRVPAPDGTSGRRS